MTTRTFTVNEIISTLKKEPFKFIRLVNDQGETVVPMNIRKGDLDAVIKDIQKALSSGICPDGIYYLRYKNTAVGGEQQFKVQKGEVSAAESSFSEPVILSSRRESKEDSPNILSYQEVLKLQTELVTKQAENDRLRELLEDAEDDEEGYLREDSQSEMIHLISEVLLPLAERALNAYEQANGLSAARPLPTQSRPAPGVTPPDRAAPRYTPRPAPAINPQLQPTIVPFTPVYPGSPGAYSGAPASGQQDEQQQQQQQQEETITQEESDTLLEFIRASSPDDIFSAYENLQREAPTFTHYFELYLQNTRPELLQDFINRFQK